MVSSPVQIIWLGWRAGEIEIRGRRIKSGNPGKVGIESTANIHACCATQYPGRGFLKLKLQCAKVAGLDRDRHSEGQMRLAPHGAYTKVLPLSLVKVVVVQTVRLCIPRPMRQMLQGQNNMHVWYVVAAF